MWQQLYGPTFILRAPLQFVALTIYDDCFDKASIFAFSTWHAKIQVSSLFLITSLFLL